MQPTTSSTATGSLMPDSPSRVRAIRRRRVDPRSTANTAAASVAATVEPSSSASSVSSSANTARAASPVSAAVSTVPTVASAIDTRDHRPDLRPAARQPALEQDQRQRDDRAVLRRLVVAEVDPAESVDADRHPDAEHEHQAGQPQAPGEQRRADARGQQRADRQREVPHVHEPAEAYGAVRSSQPLHPGLVDGRIGRRDRHAVGRQRERAARPRRPPAPRGSARPPRRPGRPARTACDRARARTSHWPVSSGSPRRCRRRQPGEREQGAAVDGVAERDPRRDPCPPTSATRTSRRPARGSACRPSGTRSGWRPSPAHVDRRELLAAKRPQPPWHAAHDAGRGDHGDRLGRADVGPLQRLRRPAGRAGRSAARGQGRRPSTACSGRTSRPSAPRSAPAPRSPARAA